MTDALEKGAALDHPLQPLQIGSCTQDWARGLI